MHFALFIYQIQNKNKALEFTIEYSFRNSGALRLPHFVVLKCNQSLIYQISQLYNYLPNKTKLVSS